MAYIDGFIIPVANTDKSRFTDHATRIDKHFLDYGATRVVEGWADDVPEGKITDFNRAVQASGEESVAFSWIEWPDKPTRDTAMAAMESNEAMMAEPMPFDGKRMIFGGFSPIVDQREGGTLGYIDGFVAPVSPGKRDAYVAMAQKAAGKFIEYGALRSSENWGDDVPEGKVTDFPRSVKAEGDEAVVFSWVEWPDKATRDAGWAKMMADDSMRPDEMPFDGKRMFWGGFKPVVELGK
ncbi:MAG: DUF1428 domain-containing protein [Novosphingobium sp.]